MYALVFLLTALGTLGLLALVPDRGVMAAKARLQALEAVGPGLIHVEGARAWHVRDRRKAKARRKQMAERVAFVARAFLLMFACGAATGISFGIFGTVQVLAVLAMAGLAGMFVVPVFKTVRVWAVNRQIPHALGLLAQHLEASNSFFGAVEAVAARGPWPIRAEFRRVSTALRGQATVDQAFQAFALRNPTPEAHLIAKILSAPQTAGQSSMVPALGQARKLLAEFTRAGAKAAAWDRLSFLWAFGLTILVGELAVLGIARTERPLGLFAILSAVSLATVAFWWFGRRKTLERGRLEGRLGLLVDSGVKSGRTALDVILTLGAGHSRHLQRLSDASVRALCHVACMLGAGLSLESAIGAVVLRPGKRGRLEQELFALLQEVRSGAPPHSAALALAGRCEIPELRGFAAALAPGSRLAVSVEAVAQESLSGWPGRARSAALASCGLASGAAIAALLPLAGLAFAP